MNQNSSSEETGIVELNPFTPFKAYRNNENEKWKIVAGNMQVSPQTFNSIEEAIDYVNKPTWELIGALCIIINENMAEAKKQNNEN